MQAVYVPADDLTDPAPATTFTHLDAKTVLSRKIVEQGIYPAVDPLDSTSRILEPDIVGERHYKGRTRCTGAAAALPRTAGHHRHPRYGGAWCRRPPHCRSCPPHAAVFLAAVPVAEQFTGLEGRYVTLEDTISGFEALLGGELDQYPEAAFSMVGTVDEVHKRPRIWGAL